MKKALTPILLLLFILQSFAQQNVPPCPQPGSSYFDAPLLDCCLDGYHFMTQPVGGLETPIGFCGTVDNGQWLAFMADSHVTEMTIGIEVTNCLNPPNNQGIQIQVFGIGNSCGLASLFPVSNCIETNGLDSVTATDLVAGHVYYILLDGNGGDICEYMISVLNQEKCTPPSSYIAGPTSVVFGQTATYTLVRPPDTCDYELHNPCNNIKQDTVTCAGLCTDNTPADTTWTGPPGSTVMPIPGTLSANITMGAVSGLVTITITGPCHFETYSLFVNVCLPPSTPFISGPQQLCEGEAANYTADGSGSIMSVFMWSLPSNIPYTPISANTISVPSPVSGNYCVSAVNSCGVSPPTCIHVTVYDNPTVQLGTLDLCQDDLPYYFNGETVSTSGYYVAVLNTWNGCDSTVTQQINVLPAVTASITSSNGTVLPPSGSTVLDAGNGFASYLWQDGAAGQTLVADQPGTYSVTVTNAAGCTATASIMLTQATANCPNFNSPIAPADSCATAPSFCAGYLNGFCSSNGGYNLDVPGNLGSVIPCTLENNQWLKFTACDTFASIVFSVSNCLAATGLEFFLLQTTDCQFFTSQAACFEIANGGTDTLIASNLTIGQTYYLMVDGIAGDICSWEVLSTSGLSEGAVYQAQNTPGQVESVGDVDSYCVGGTGSFYFTPAYCGLSLVSGCPAFQQACIPQLDTCTAIQFDTIWHVTPAGAIFENNDSTGANVNIIFPDTLPVPTGGFLEFVVSVEFVPINQDTFTCWSDCLAECRTILADSQACAILPKTIKVCAPDDQAVAFDLCPGECIDFMGVTYCNPGTQTVTQQDVCGCTDTYTVTINWIPEPPPFVSQATYACSSDGTTYTVSFTVEGFGSMILIDGQPLSGDSFTSAPIPSGSPYIFTVEALTFCGNIIQLQVSGSHTCPPCIGDTFDLGTMAICPGECFDLLGNSYCTAGNYQVELFNPSTNCFETYIFNIQEIVENALAVGPVSEFCEAANLFYMVGFQIESGNPPYWVNGNPIPGSFYQSGLIPTGQPYSFTVTDAATCDPQQVNISGAFSCPCLNDPGTVELSLISTCDGQMANANFNNDAIVDPNSLLVFVLHTSPTTQPGTVIGMNATGSFGFVPGLMNFGETYYISPAVGPASGGGGVDMANQCFSLAPGQPVVFYPMPSVDILQPDTLTCAVSALLLGSLPSGGSGIFDYAWSGPNNFVSSLASPTVSEPGVYALLLTDNLTGCQDQSATNVASNTEQPVFAVTNGEINCEQPNATLEASSQTPGLFYTWTFPTGDVMTGASITTNIPGDYSVIAIGANGCEADAITNVADNGVPPSLTVSGAGSINCSQPSLLLTASSNEPSAIITWTLPDSSTSVGPSLDAGMVGIYQVIALAPNGCTAEAVAAVGQGADPELAADLVATPPTCHGDSDGSIKVMGASGGNGPYIFQLNGAPFSGAVENLSAGDYLLSVEDADGCTDEFQVQLAAPEAVMVEIGDDLFVNMGEQVTLTFQSNIAPDSILWMGPNGQTWQGVNTLSIQPSESGTYFIVISDVSACRSSDTLRVYVNGQGRVYLPNVFSPNGDGQNDLMTVYAGNDVRKVLNFQIFDRWGEMVFEDKEFAPNDPERGWNGRHKDRPMDPAVFVVKAEVEFLDGSKKTVMGDVILLR